MLRNILLTCFLCFGYQVLWSDTLQVVRGDVEEGQWTVVREFSQKSYPRFVPAGNYSGITHLHDDVYAVVSDKSDSVLFFKFRIQIDELTGELRHVENLGYDVMVDGSRYDGKSWIGKDRGFDHEAIAKVSDSTLMVASEGFFCIREFFINPSSRNAEWNSRLRKIECPSAAFAPNYAFESLAFDSVRHYLWTIPESTLQKDGEPATPQNGGANKLRLMRIDIGDLKGIDAQHLEGIDVLRQNSDDSDSVNVGGKHLMEAYAYRMDKPTTNKKAETYVMGVSELCVLPDGQLLVLEREAFIPKMKLGAFCKCKLYLINPLQENPYPIEQPFCEATPYINKHLLLEWKTGLSVFDRSFANYEGMCLGPKLKNGDQVAIAMETARRSPIHFPLNAKAAIEQAGMAVDAIRFAGHDAQSARNIGFIPGLIGHVVPADRVREDITQGQAGLGFPEELLRQEPCFIVTDTGAKQPGPVIDQVTIPIGVAIGNSMLQLGQADDGIAMAIVLIAPFHGKPAAVFLDGIGSAAIRLASCLTISIYIRRAHRIKSALMQGPAPTGHGMRRIITDEGRTVVLAERQAAVIGKGIAAIIGLDPPARIF